MKNNVIDIKSPVDALTELLRTSARKIVIDAMELELENFLQEFSETLSDGKRRVVRNGYLPKRDIMTGIGKVGVQVPRVRDRSDLATKIQFRSSLIPPYLRRSTTLDEVLPLLYLKGISERDFVEALKPIFGNETHNLSPSVISRLKMKWNDEYNAWCNRDLSENQYVYWWVDGIHFTGRLDDKRCVLVILGVNECGKKELIAIEDGFRESTESWTHLLRKLKSVE